MASKASQKVPLLQKKCSNSIEVVLSRLSTRRENYVLFQQLLAIQLNEQIALGSRQHQ